MNLIAKTLIGALMVLLLVVVAIAAFSLALWLMIPLAFPMLPWTYWNALALAWIILLVGLPWVVSN